MDCQVPQSTPPAGEACAKLLNLTGLDAAHFAVLVRCADDTSRKYAKLNPFRVVLHLVEDDASKIQQLVPDLDKEPTVAETCAVLKHVHARSVPFDDSWDGFTEGCKKVAETLEKFQTLMGDMYDEETMSHLVYIESLEAAERAQLEARLSLSTNEAASLGALLRFSVGYRLGHLNKPKSWSALSFLHQPIEDMGMRPSRASAVAHRWLARPFSIAFFKIGRATPPFSLVPYDNHAKAVYWLKKDQENAKKAFKEIVEEEKITVEDAGAAIRTAQFHAAGRWLPEAGEDRDKILKGLNRTEEYDERATGSGRVLYDQFQVYFDLPALFLPEEPDKDMIAKWPGLKAAADALLAVYNEKGFINPIDIDKVLPGYPYDSALTLLRCNGADDLSSDSDSDNSDD